MTTFIELHATNLEDEPISINISHICSFIKYGNGCEVYTSDGTRFTVAESYDTVKCLIIDAGRPMAISL